MPVLLSVRFSENALLPSSANARLALLLYALLPSWRAVDAQEVVKECAIDKPNFSTRANPAAPGVTFAALEGDPNGSGYFVAQLTFAPGGRIAPHWHPALKRISVQQGTLNLQLGADSAQSVQIAAGSTLAVSARTIHAEGSRDGAVVWICGVGPLMTHSMSTPMGQPDLMTAMSDTLPSVVVDRFFARYNAHDVEGLQALVAPGVVWATVVNDSLHVELRGRDALVRYLATSFAKTSGVGSARSASIVVGPFVTFREDAYWQGASGRRTQSALVVYEVRGGLIRSARYF